MTPADFVMQDASYVDEGTSYDAEWLIHRDSRPRQAIGTGARKGIDTARAVPHRRLPERPTHRPYPAARHRQTPWDPRPPFRRANPPPPPSAHSDARG